MSGVAWQAAPAFPSLPSCGSRPAVSLWPALMSTGARDPLVPDLHSPHLDGVLNSAPDMPSMNVQSPLSSQAGGCDADIQLGAIISYHGQLPICQLQPSPYPC
jgi:hypothetical protein